MQILIIRTPIFDQQVLPVLKQQAKIARVSLEDHIRGILYKSFGFHASRRTAAQVQADRVIEQAVTAKARIPSLVVAVSPKFYKTYNVNMHMRTINKIVYEAAGCGSLYR